jgi:hypothetical protein
MVPHLVWEGVVPKQELSVSDAMLDVVDHEYGGWSSILGGGN